MFRPQPWAASIQPFEFPLKLWPQTLFHPQKNSIVAILYSGIIAFFHPCSLAFLFSCAFAFLFSCCFTFLRSSNLPPIILVFLHYCNIELLHSCILAFLRPVPTKSVVGLGLCNVENWKLWWRKGDSVSCIWPDLCVIQIFKYAQSPPLAQ